jgi:hypothetical protein
VIEYNITKRCKPPLLRAGRRGHARTLADDTNRFQTNDRFPQLTRRRMSTSPAAIRSPLKREILLKRRASTPVGFRAHGSARKQPVTIPAARLAAYDGVNGLFRLARRGRSELDRSRLVRDLVHHIQVEEFQPRYRRADFGRPVCGWPDRLRSYFWPNPSVDYTATYRLMQGWFDGAGELSRRLLDRGTWTSVDGGEAAELAMEMLR